MCLSLKLRFLTDFLLGKIEVFDLSDNYFGPEAFRTVLLALGYLPNLKSLNISSNNSDKFCSVSIIVRFKH